MANGIDLADALVGRFWLAEEDEHAVTGRLTLAQGANPWLELDQPLTPSLREVDRKDQTDGFRTFVEAEEGPGNESLVVHGAFDDGTLVTLVDAFTKRRRSRAGQDRQWIQARFALLGAHVAGRYELYTQIRLQLQNLDAWAALPGFSLDENDPRQGRATLAFRGSGPSPVSLEGGGTLDLEQEPEVEFSALRGGRIGRVVWLRVVDLPPRTADDLDRRFVIPLSSLLTLATDTGCPPVAIEVAIAPDQPWLTVHHSGLRAPTEEVRATHRQLLPLAVLGLDRVATWLDAVEDLGPLPPVVADAAARSDLTLETQLLELVTVAEGLHRRLSRRLSPEQAQGAWEAVNTAVDDFAQRVPEAREGTMTHLKDPSFSERLGQLADCVVVAMPGVTGRTDRWRRCVTETRNKFAHRDYGFLETTRISELVSVLESVRWLLTGLLLLQTGLPPGELAARIENHQPYIFFRRQAREWLPRVFEAQADQ